MKKRSEKKRLKDKAWTLLSKYVRLKSSNFEGYTNCVTCGRIDHWKNMQAGHFLDGRTNGTLWDERGIHVQCYVCNVCKHGNKVQYYKFMLKKYGQDVIDELIQHAAAPHPMSAEDYKLLVDKYTVLVREFE